MEDSMDSTAPARQMPGAPPEAAAARWLRTIAAPFSAERFGPASGETDRTRGSALRLSHAVKSAHYAALALLVAVAAGVAFWMSQEYTRLARDSSKALVGATLNTLEERVRTVLTDYSYWDEAFEAATADDRVWLYRNIGTAATETQLVDRVVISGASPDGSFGWVIDGGTDPQSDVLPNALIEDLLAKVRNGPTDPDNVWSGFGWLEDRFWLFAVTRFLPYDVSTVPDDGSVPKRFQIHAVEMNAAKLGELGQQTLIDGFRLEPAGSGNPFWLPLTDTRGETVAELAWELPSPGLRILGKIAIPLATALSLVLLIAVAFSRLAVRSAERLERALEQAQAADRTKSEFLANVSHELRTPMNAVIGITDLLKASELSERNREMVGVLGDAAASHMELLEKLLDFSQLETGNRALSFQRFDVAQLIDGVAKSFALAAENKGIDLKVETLGDHRHPTVLGDPIALRQIVTNVVQNAIKFTDTGSVTISLRMTAILDEVDCEIEVRDTGTGIAEEDRDRIFDRFVSLKDEARAPEAGAGLGLAISRSLATLMGATLEMTSVPGQGSVFTLRNRFEIGGAPERKDGDDRAA